ncbi:MAG: divergent polysaccharide deacetylase family protein [Labrys sp. (in: a-proteobacteria)]
MSTNELTTPLGLDTAQKPARRFRIPVLAVLGAIVAAVFLVFAGWIAIVRDPLGGEPVAIVAIEKAATSAPTAEPAAGEKPSTPGVVEVDPNKTAGPNVAGAEAVEEASGVKVIRAGDASAPSAVIVRAPEEKPREGPLAAVRPELTEKGRQGPLPKIGPDGERPLDAYSRPVTVPPTLAKTPDVPRIAILVGGLGISQSGTSAAIAKLPPEVTLAFAPYGDDLPTIVQRARAQGHEVMLHAPMEPFDYPDNDPGPQTLLSDSSPEQNLDRLRWQMSRFPAYVGIVNYMGARFTSSEAAMGPVLKEIGSRGLLYADDGTSPRSLAAGLARSGEVPDVGADVVIDAEPSPKAIDGALARLEQLARERGMAMGVATGLPISIDRIAAWAEKLDERGILLVPVTGLLPAR